MAPLAQRWLELALEGLWLGTLIAAAAALGLRGLPRLRPAARHAMLLATLVAVAAAPFVRPLLGDATSASQPAQDMAAVAAVSLAQSPARDDHAASLTEVAKQTTRREAGVAALSDAPARAATPRWPTRLVPPGVVSIAYADIQRSNLVGD